MTSIISDLSGIKNNDIICSVRISPSKKWIRTLTDIDGNQVNIHKLRVERSLNSDDCWILCLYNQDPKQKKHVFWLDFSKIRIRRYPRE